MAQAPRNTTWIQDANVIFVDSPVGTGFSYVDDLSLLTTNVTQISADFVNFMIGLTARYPIIKTLPLHIFSESYGGKMNIAIAQAVLQAMDAGVLSLNFKGVALGDSWISGSDYVNSWGPWLRYLSVMDAHELSSVVQPVVDQCNAAVAAGDWAAATNYWNDVENAVGEVTDNISWYNVLVHNDPDGLSQGQSVSGAAARVSAAGKMQLRKGAAAGAGTGAAAKVAQQAALQKQSKKALSPAAISLATQQGVSAAAVQALYERHVLRRDAAVREGPLGNPLCDDTELSNLMNGPVRTQLGLK